MSSAYERITFRGKTVNRRTASMLMQAEDALGYELTILQGSYNTSVEQSGGTHDGGGAVDLAAYDKDKKVRVLRECGFAAWYRPTLPGEWNEHVHAIAIGDQQMSDAARRQVQDYYAGLNGLASHARDDTWRPNPIVVARYPLGAVNVKAVQDASKSGKAINGVRHVQRSLNVKTGTHLKVDGVWGDKTGSAYGRYEKQVGGDGDGSPAFYALRKLGLALYRVKE